MEKNLIFDFDGTVINSLPLAIRTLHEAGHKYNIESLKDVHVEKLRDLSIPEIFKELKIPFWTLPFLVTWARRRMHSQIHNIPLVEGIIDAFRELKKNDNRLFMLTSNSEKNVRISFEDNKIIHLFDDIIGGVGTFSKKRAMKKLLRKYNLKKEDCIYITDEIRDVIATNDINMTNIAVAWGYNSEKALMGVNPNHLVHTPNELVKIIEELK